MSKKRRFRFSYIALAIFLTLYQSQYFWMKYLDSIDGFLMLSYLGLGFSLFVYWIYKSFKTWNEWTKNWKSRLIHIAFLLLLILPRFVPGGFINWENYKSPVKWSAYREGTMNCTIGINFREDQSFERRDVCFSTEYKEGQYRQNGDTLFLTYAPQEDTPMDTLVVDFAKGEKMRADLLTMAEPLYMIFYRIEKD